LSPEKIQWGGGRTEEIGRGGPHPKKKKKPEEKAVNAKPIGIVNCRPVKKKQGRERREKGRAASEKGAWRPRYVVCGGPPHEEGGKWDERDMDTGCPWERGPSTVKKNHRLP